MILGANLKAANNDNDSQLSMALLFIVRQIPSQDTLERAA